MRRVLGRKLVARRTSGAATAWKRPSSGRRRTRVVVRSCPSAFERDGTSVLAEAGLDSGAPCSAPRSSPGSSSSSGCAGWTPAPEPTSARLGWYIGVWVTMMAAMMLPSVAPMVLVFARVSRERARDGTASCPTWIFVAGYLAAWTAYGLAGVRRLPRRSTRPIRASSPGTAAGRTSPARARGRRDLPADAAEGASACGTAAAAALRPRRLARRPARRAAHGRRARRSTASAAAGG